METKRYKPQIDKLFHIIWIPTAVLLLGVSVLAAFEPTALLVVIVVDALCAYFLVSPLFGYVELRESALFIKFGFILKREISYTKIRGTQLVRKWYSDSMLSLKNSMEHVNIKYNTFDILSVSVRNNEEFMREIKARVNYGS